MRPSRQAAFALRFALALLAVATTMAVSCPQPTPPEPDPPEVDTKSAERRQLEGSHMEGLYLKGSCVLPFDLASFQRAGSVGRKTYRIQSDDQTRYLHVRYTEGIPVGEGDEVECEIHYRLAAGESTTLIVKLVVVKSTEEYLWLWNEFQKVGMIVQRLS
ncbi:MAG: hypothetical protein IJ636_05675 [Bacteroidales bacterium]|nr:hypothetical protein [Bacteroidales bacterium]